MLHSISFNIVFICHASIRIKTNIDQQIRMSNIDSVIALSYALLVNAAILIVAAAAFYSQGITNVADLNDAFHLLISGIGPASGYTFAIALLLAGQSSTITGTIAGIFYLLCI